MHASGYPPAAPVSVEALQEVRSLLSMIRAIVQHMSELQRDAADFATHLSGRLGAISRVREIIMRSPGAPVDLAELVEDEFLSQGVLDRAVRTTTESLPMSGPVACAMALAVHELTTNSIKFGALGAPAGRVAVRWETFPGPDPWSRLSWREDCCAAPHRPCNGDGFGFELLRTTLPQELGARTRLELGADGLSCDIEFRPMGGEPTPGLPAIPDQ
jgi:two-component sensor histidine kinase